MSNSTAIRVIGVVLAVLLSGGTIAQAQTTWRVNDDTAPGRPLVPVPVF